MAISCASISFVDYNESVEIIDACAAMATLTIRNLDDDLKANLRVRAALHGQSMEEEVRIILRQALSKSLPETGLGQRLATRFSAVASELETPPHSKPRAAPTWDDS